VLTQGAYLRLWCAAAVQGDWVENKMHGSGTITTTDQHKWSGQFYNGAGPGLTCHV
jgi:hypothetical protein